jgi:hypothetical protein
MGCDVVILKENGRCNHKGQVEGDVGRAAGLEIQDWKGYLPQMFCGQSDAVNGMAFDTELSSARHCGCQLQYVFKILSR